MARKGKGQLPTPKQLDVLRVLRRFQRRHGYSPSLEELGEILDVTKITIYQHVRELERKGCLTRLRYQARSLRVVDDEQAEALDADEGKLKLVGTIAAGSPLEVYEVPDQIDLEQFFAHPERVYALKVTGDSMIDDHIRDGDYVIVEPRREAQSGQTVVARLASGEVTLKKFYRERRRIRLQPANPKMKPIYAKDVEILGVVIGLLRKY